jgi:hypothetical protein
MLGMANTVERSHIGRKWTFAAQGIGMRIFTFRCSRQADLYAVSTDPRGRNLPEGVCTGNWEPISNAEVQPGDGIAGFVSRDLFRDLDDHGYHLAIGGPRVTKSSDEVRVGAAIAAANVVTRFFSVD